MKPATLARIFASAQEGPSRRLTRDELILEFTTRDVKQPRALVERIARREHRKQRSYGNRFISLDDIRGELTLSLIRLIDRYQEGRSDCLDAYIAQHLGWRAVDALESAQMMRDSQEQFVNVSGEEVVCEASARGRRRDTGGKMRSIPFHRDSSAGLDVHVLIGQLGDVDRAVIEAYLVTLAESDLSGNPDATQLDVALEMGVSQATVSRAMKRIRALVHKTR